MKRVNILLAEDDTRTGIVISLALRALGHSVEVVPDGDRALARISERPAHYHILIVDHVMPNVSGLEIIRELRGKSFAGKIVVLSGFLTETLMNAYRALGVETFVEKPFEPDVLGALVRSLAHSM